MPPRRIAHLQPKELVLHLGRLAGEHPSTAEERDASVTRLNRAPLDSLLGAAEAIEARWPLASPRRRFEPWRTLAWCRLAGSQAAAPVRHALVESGLTPALREDPRFRDAPTWVSTRDGVGGRPLAAAADAESRGNAYPDPVAEAWPRVFRGELARRVAANLVRSRQRGSGKDVPVLAALERLPPDERTFAVWLWALPALDAGERDRLVARATACTDPRARVVRWPPEPGTGPAGIRAALLRRNVLDDPRVPLPTVSGFGADRVAFAEGLARLRGEDVAEAWLGVIRDLPAEGTQAAAAVAALRHWLDATAVDGGEAGPDGALGSTVWDALDRARDPELALDLLVCVAPTTMDADRFVAAWRLHLPGPERGPQRCDRIGRLMASATRLPEAARLVLGSTFHALFVEWITEEGLGASAVHALAGLLRPAAVPFLRRLDVDRSALGKGLRPALLAVAEGEALDVALARVAAGGCGGRGDATRLLAASEALRPEERRTVVEALRGALASTPQGRADTARWLEAREPWDETVEGALLEALCEILETADLPASFPALRSASTRGRLTPRAATALRGLALRLAGQVNVADARDGALRLASILPRPRVEDWSAHLEAARNEEGARELVARLADMVQWSELPSSETEPAGFGTALLEWAGGPVSAAHRSLLAVLRDLSSPDLIRGAYGLDVPRCRPQEPLDVVVAWSDARLLAGHDPGTVQGELADVRRRVEQRLSGLVPTLAADFVPSKEQCRALVEREDEGESAVVVARLVQLRRALGRCELAAHDRKRRRASGTIASGVGPARGRVSLSADELESMVSAAAAEHAAAERVRVRRIGRPRPARADEFLVEPVLQNLLSNALLHGRPHPVHVAIFEGGFSVRNRERDVTAAAQRVRGALGASVSRGLAGVGRLLAESDARVIVDTGWIAGEPHLVLTVRWSSGG